MLDETSPAPSNMRHDSIIERVLRTVAAHENIPTTELPPLFDVIDPDALAALFQTPPDDAGRSDGYVTFRYAGYQLTVAADGSIAAERINGPDVAI